MANTQGIIFNNLFINNKDLFIDYFSEYYKKQKAEIDAVVDSLDKILREFEGNSLNSTIANQFRAAWDKFERVVLLNTNTDLQLIVGYRNDDNRSGGKNIEFSEIIKQSDAEIDSGIDSGSKAVKDAIAAAKAKNVNDIFKHHLGGFLNNLYEKVDRPIAQDLRQYHEAFLPSEFQKRKNEKYEHLLTQDGQPKWRWQEIYYSKNYYSGQGLGKAYDAYMNHLANHHKQIYNYLSSSGMTGGNEQIKLHSSVFNEEGGVGQYGGFPRLLKESTNTTGWYTGGDIIIVNPETMNVVYNIQLKTTSIRGERIPSIFAERIEKIRIFIHGGTVKKGKKEKTIPALSTLTPKEKAERMFEFLLTSISNRNDFDNIIPEDINNILKGSLEKITLHSKKIML